jgi:hypothetical protein
VVKLGAQADQVVKEGIPFSRFSCEIGLVIQNVAHRQPPSVNNDKQGMNFVPCQILWTLSYPKLPQGWLLPHQLGPNHQST